MRRGTQRGFSLVELMVALGLSAMVATGTLILVRSQLVGYELNDSLMKAQQNARAGLEFMEGQLRRSCGCLSEGVVALNVPGLAPVVSGCVHFWDNAVQSGGTFTSGAVGSDAIEVLYCTANTLGSYTVASSMSGFTTTTPAVTVTDMSGFAVGDLVLVTNFKRGNLYRISTINGGAGPATGAGPIAFASPSSNAINATGYVPTAGDAVVKASSAAIYYVAGAAPTPGQLYYDPDGMVGANHTDAQPLIDGVSDLQFAIGADMQTVAPATGTANDGLIAEAAAPATGNDEWIGNASAETLPAPPWNLSPAAAPMLRQIRSTVVVRTINSYPSPIPNLGPFEDGALITAAVSATGRYPRFRVMRSIVAPRVWNLAE